MKISKLFHWLYAAIMFLPLLVAPIFAIYSHRHTIDSYQVTRDKYQVVDFNQYLPSYTNSNTITLTNEDKTNIIDYNYDGYKFDISLEYEYYQNYEFPISDLFTLNNNHKILFRFFDYDTNLRLHLWGNNQNINVDENYTTFIFDSGEYYNYRLFFQINLQFIGNYTYSNYLNLIDLTQMFGEGNEPTIEQFNTWYPNDYYEYTTSKKELLQNGTETLNNTDIGSQFVYAIYNPLNDYFNFNNYLGIGNLYNWMQLNLFKGTAPLGFFIFWELLMYWLLVSLIWLIFDIAMYVPNLAHRWLDKASLE